MLAGLLLSSPAFAARTERKAKPLRETRPEALKGECVGDTGVDCWNAAAMRLAQQGKLEEARQAIEMAFKADPRLAALRGNLEKVYAGLARQAYDSALGLASGKEGVDLAGLPKVARPKADRLASAAPEKPVRPSRKAEPKPAAVEPPKSRAADSAVAPRPAVPAAKDSALQAPKPEAVRPVPPPGPVRRAGADSLPRAVAIPSIPRPVPFPARKDSAAPRPVEVAGLPPRVMARPRPQPLDSVVPRPTAPSRKEPKEVRRDTARAVPAASARRPDPARSRAEVRKALEAWAGRWSAKDAEGYLSCYAPSFQPQNGAERAAWEAQRRERIAAPASIDVTFEALRVESADSGRVETQFLQHYRTDAVKLRSRKRLLWEKVGEAWKIVSEGEVK